MEKFWSYTRVILFSLLVGTVLFAGSFIAVDFLWTHVVVTNRQDIGLGDGVMVVGGGFIMGCTVGVAGFLWVLRKFWPRRSAN
jgi:hypothetical protein